ncbi:hypothetical protein D0B54_23950 [Solimonas sp. K1W22B-7]|uniref:hypothetical protein n=1 Tax=Solimonas sp. K1W22B-7 TaxID=2303331 RepID=UPI000E3310FE|nr:hypothetical protein [Solimonas sp. K1W22B-7]AXQ31551.1 hypothetical protein D0B54_23950 [Solimonas sp. K1W22B-7]
MRRIVLLTGLLAASAQLAACAQPMNQPESSASAPVAGKVTDTAAFERYIATRPSAEQFRTHYPDVRLVLPGDIATKELRHDNSRYFAETDSSGRITGGRFQ